MGTNIGRHVPGHYWVMSLKQDRKGFWLRYYWKLLLNETCLMENSLSTAYKEGHFDVVELMMIK